MGKNIPKKRNIRTGTELSKFMESDFPVDLKKCSGRWEYIENNKYAASVSGLDPNDRLGMTIYDIGRINRIPDAAVEKIVYADHSVSKNKAPITLIHAFLDQPNGFIVVDRVVKQAVVDQQDKMAGVLSYAQDIVPYMDRCELYALYRNGYSKEQAIHKFLKHMRVDSFFTVMPTDLDISLLLSGQQQIEKLSQLFNLSIDEVRSCQNRLQDKLVMIDYAELVQRLAVPEKAFLNV